MILNDGNLFVNPHPPSFLEFFRNSPGAAIRALSDHVPRFSPEKIAGAAPIS
jgi:hypothetical protein